MGLPLRVSQGAIGVPVPWNTERTNSGAPLLMSCLHQFWNTHAPSTRGFLRDEKDP